jgi:hypothetical protein
MGGGVGVAQESSTLSIGSATSVIKDVEDYRKATDKPACLLL